MESAEKEKAAIISGIEADAKAEEQQIIEEAQKQAADKEKYYDKKVESMLQEARQEAQQQAESLKKKMDSNIKLELKRSYMQAQQNVIREIKSRIEEKLNSMIDNPGYRKVLSDWITEAAIGLGAESASINASEKERTLIDQNLIHEVAEKVKKLTGRKINLQLAQQAPLKLQGVILTAADGRTAFNNQIKTRISRKNNEIQMMIYKAIFADGRKEVV